MHSPADDAHKHGSRNHRPSDITQVIVDLNVVGIPQERVRKILECLNTDRYFILHNDEALIQYWPSKLFAEYKNTAGEVQEFIFPNMGKLVDSIKLNLLVLTQLLIPALPVEGRPKQRRIK